MAFFLSHGEAAAGRGGKMASGPRRRRVEPTDQWEQIELLCGWPEQRDYELIRPLVLFGGPADARARETGEASSRTLRRRAARFEVEGMESLFGSEAAHRRKKLPPAMRRLIVDLKAEYPGFNPNEISRVCYVRFGRRPARKTVKRVLAEEPVPLRFVRRFPPYHQIPERRDGRAAVVALHADGWSAKAIAGYLRVGTSTVYRVLKRWAEEGPDGLEDKPRGRPPGVRKVTLKAMEAIRRFQENPNLGEYRIHAALAQIGIHLSPRTCGRILDTLRAGARRPGLHALQALEALRRGGPGGQGGGAVARGRKPHRRARREAALPLRGQGRGDHRGAQIGGATEALRILARAASSAAAPLRVGLLRRGRVVEGDEARGLRPPLAAASASAAGGAVPLRGGPVGVRCVGRAGRLATDCSKRMADG